MSPETFAYNEYKDYIIYTELAKKEKNPAFKKFLNEIISHELEHFKFWQKLSRKKKFKINKFEIFLFKLARKTLGLTFSAKYLEGHERETVREYSKYLKKTSGATRAELKKIIEQEKYHEIELIGHLKEGKVEFMSSIMLGLSDSLIELTGILVGFSFIFNSNQIIALSGLISGIAASLSMSSSGYMQARYEKEKDEKKAALYTGVSYILVVLLLIAPFFIFSDKMISLAAMLIIEITIITAVTAITSVLFSRKFLPEFAIMLTFSLGVSIISFLIGSLFRHLSGINI